MNFKTILPHAVAVIVFFVLTVVIYSPAFFDGQKLSQHDVLQAFGAHQQLKEYKAETGEEALWMNTMFSGMPAYLNGVQYSGDLLKYAYAAINLGLRHPVSLTFLSFVSFYIMLLAFGVRSWLAMAGAILFGLNGFNIISISAGHNAKIAAVALMPLVLAGIKLAFTDKRWLGVGLTALALGLQIRANHPQMTYYLLLVVVIFGLFELIQAVKEKRLQPFFISIAGLVLAASLAVGANAGRLYHTYDYGKYSIRGASDLESDGEAKGLDYEYAFRFSNGITEPLVMFYPNYLGGSSSQELSEKSNVAEALMKTAGYSRLQAKETIKAMPTYWGDQPLTAPYYAGSVLLFLFVLGLFVLPTHQKIWLIVAAIFGIAMSWGKNAAGFNNLLFDYLPGYNKFRSVTFTIIIPILAINLLAFTGIEKWLTLNKAEQWKSLKRAVMVAGGISVLFLIISGMMSYRGAIDAQLPDWLISAIRDDRKALFRQSVIRAIVFTGLAFMALWLIHKDKLKTQFALLLLVGIVLIDVVSLSKRFLNKDNFQEDPAENYFRATGADEYIMSNAAPGERVLNLINPWNEARTSYYHESIGGYHGAKMRRYQDLVDNYLGSEANQAITKLQNGRRDFSDLKILNMLNAKYLVAGNQKEAVITNPSAFGNAWVASDVVKAQHPSDVMNQLGSIDPRKTAVVDLNEADPKFGGQGTIALTERTPNKLVYTANISNGTALGIFSEVYYPKSWVATIDGKETEILRANYILRALEIPEGQHDIVFEFKPQSYATTNTIMMVCSIMILLGFVGTVGLELKKL